MKIEKKGAAGSNDPSILPYRTKITMEKFPTTFTDFFPLSVEARATYNDTEQSWHLKSREISDTSAAGDPKSKLYSRTFSPRSDFVFPFSHPSSLSLSLSPSIYLSICPSLSFCPVTLEITPLSGATDVGEKRQRGKPPGPSRCYHFLSALVIGPLGRLA